mmetsp:Transcript_3084/g.5283  ORF Transcript_3084/g.5283 Transcript_3084/m.5283 type:complete len:254 (-) Transcript_3084:970-1731(-)
MAQGHRLPGGRGLRPVRNGPGRDHQSAGPARLQWQHRPAHPRHRNRDPGRRRPRPGPGRARRDLHPRPAGHGRLLEAARRDRQRHVRRRLLQERRHRHHGRARLCAHRRPQEGHDPGQRFQCVSERGRGRADADARRARMRRGRRAGCQIRRGGQALRREKRSGPGRGRPDELLRPAVDGLQAPQVHRIPRRPAQDQRGQDPAPGTPLRRRLKRRPVGVRTGSERVVARPGQGGRADALLRGRPQLGVAGPQP